MPDAFGDKQTGFLLSSVEPPPFYVMHAESKQPILLVCDHAARRFPLMLGNMGLDAVARRSHLAVDIGAGPLTEYLADSLGVSAVLAQYSRLVVDCNRHLTDAGAFLEFGDGIRIPGNAGLNQHDKDLRAQAIYHPYHAAIARQVTRLHNSAKQPVFIAIHSFTPVLNGEVRPWEIGILWDHDQGLHSVFLDGFREAGFETGDNEPYSGKAPADYTIDHHAETAGLPCVSIEVRQDLLADAAGVARIGLVIRQIIESIRAKQND